MVSGIFYFLRLTIVCTMKLKKFQLFVTCLYPHEMDFLLQKEQFRDPDRKSILDEMSRSLKTGNQPQFNISIDKRKYSAIMQWAQNHLQSMDVDEDFKWIQDTERAINLDNLQNQDHVNLQNKLKVIDASSYNFQRFYALIIQYRDYILIRNAHWVYQDVKAYLEQYEAAYQYTIKINKRLAKATIDIIEQRKTMDINSSHWESFLQRTVRDQHLDGFTRYKALIRLSYLYYNYKEYSKLSGILALYNDELRTAKFYSKRLLANYYNNVSMMNARMQNYLKAEEFGYYAVRGYNADYILYVNNLCVVLLKQKKVKAAYDLVVKVNKEQLEMITRYDFIGFHAIKIECMRLMGLSAKAYELAETFHNEHHGEILSIRWHIFYSSYFKVLLKLEKFNRIISLDKNYQLSSKETKYVKTGRYVPEITAIVLVAKYEEGKLTTSALKEALIQNLEAYDTTKHSVKAMNNLIEELKSYIPRIMKEVIYNLK